MRRFGVASFLIAVLLAAPAAADEREHCLYSSKAPNTKASIEACTRLIKSGSARSDDLVKFYVSRMGSYYTDDQYDRAIADATEILTKIQPHRPGTKVASEEQRDAYYYRGNSYYWTKQYAKAVPDLNFAIEYRATDYNALHSRGATYLAMGQLDRAIADFTATIRLDADYRLAFLGRARAYERKGDLQNALADARRSADIEKARGYSASTELEMIKGIEQKIVASGSAVPAPSVPAQASAPAGYNTDVCHGEPTAQTIAACTRLITSANLPKDELVVAYQLRGELHAAAGDRTKALADLDQAIRLDPKSTTVLNSRALMLAGWGEYQKAIEGLQEALRLEPKSATFLSNRGYVYIQARDFKRAVESYSEALAIEPRSPFQLNGRGAAYKLLGDYDRALSDLNQAIGLAPDFARLYFHRGDVFRLKGDLARARADLQRAVELDSNDSEARSTLAALEAQSRVATAAPPAPAATRPEPKPAPPPVVAARPEPTPVPPVATAPIPREVRVALVIGNSRYRTATPLTNPANDATDVAAALRKLGFDVVEGRDLDKRALEDKVREFGRKLDRASLALFFYAGHGLQVGGKNYLVPIDAKLERPGDLSFEAIDVSQVLAQMEAEQRVNLVFLDACRDNPLARTLARSLGTRSSSVGQGLATIQSAVGTMIAYATQPDNVALDGEGRNSPFTTALLKHIATPGLEISSLMKRVRGDVIQATRNKQVPWDHSSLVGDVVLAK